MQANRGRDTGPEKAVRSILHAAGLRCGVCSQRPFDRRRRADITFTRVGLDGCFWHGCPAHFTIPKTNARFWAEKVEGNRCRDADTTRRLQDMGRTVLRFWEHEAAADIVERVIHTYEALRYPGEPERPWTRPTAGSSSQDEGGDRTAVSDSSAREQTRGRARS